MAAYFKTAWGHVLQRAGIMGFRWHDLRHHLAPRLAQTGVPLDAVRNLLGHASVAMSLRHAHLAPDQRYEAVARLNSKPVLTMAVQLGMEGPRSAVHWALTAGNAMRPPAAQSGGLGLRL